MVNPINSSPHVVHVDLTSAELPSAIARPTIQVPPTTYAARTGTATAGNRHNAPETPADTPLEKTLEQLNNAMQAWATGMRFDIDEDAQRVVVSIVDSSTGEVLRTVPSDAVLRVAKMIVQLQGGSVNTRA